MFLVFFLGTLSDMIDTLDESLSFEGTVIFTFFGFTFVIDDSHLFLLLEFFVVSDSVVLPPSINVFNQFLSLQLWGC